MSGSLLDNDDSSDGGLYRPLAEINVTPFVDVMLVLLIVFMITAPMLAAGVPVRLPDGRQLTPNDTPRPIVIAVTPQGGLYVDDREMPDADLEAGVSSALAAGRERAVQLRADRDVTHGRIVDLMSRLAAMGISRILFVAREGGAPANRSSAPADSSTTQPSE